eukprot:TRINITY_DN147_c0_g2_i1.p1 TRINITY_DN147_c0_g2~~TRINITY_DN147_c0_g2_i1.p1  ORF type:complete len:419 (+),score=98.32 TRINITY_DN147_c0_g2_i1:1394-2650(+)
MAPAAAGVVVKSAADRNARALPSAPRNVFVHNADRAQTHKVHGWTNYYELPVEYSVEIHHGILSPQNSALATRYMPAAYKRRFVVIDQNVHQLYSRAILDYFAHYGVLCKLVLIEGEECNKLFSAVEKIFNELCEFGLLRREPIVAIGGGCVLDIVGFAASCYRRGVPYIRVPTTLLAIVDASVGVKCGVDWQHRTLGGLKNRMGAFYPPIAAFLDKSFIRTQDRRNVVNGMGEIMKLALVRSAELFALLEQHGARLIEQRFQSHDHVADRVIELSIQVMLEELGPNLWEYHLERCVDYGHTFSKIVEMQCNGAVMHGEAVNIDGFLCILLSHRKGWISTQLRNRVFAVMKRLGLPTWHAACTLKVLTKAVADGVEHRHGKLRMPLVKGSIGSYAFVNECKEDDLKAVIAQAREMHAC